MSTHEQRIPGNQQKPASGADPTIEFSHVEKVLPVGPGAASVRPSITPFTS